MGTPSTTKTSGSTLHHAVRNARVRMQKQARRGTKPELILRSALHRRGLRYRVHRQPFPGIRREADVLFTRVRVAVFIDGCFWHVCPQHASWPKRHAAFWRTKLKANVQRDRDTDKRLQAQGWVSVRVWEHEDPEAAAARIESVVRARQQELDAS